MYWRLGEMVSSYKKENNSKYASYVVKRFTEELYSKYGAGFNRNNIFRAVQFYNKFPIVHPGAQSKNEKVPLGGQFKNINWTHIRELLKFKDINVIFFYLNEVENKKPIKATVTILS